MSFYNTTGESGQILMDFKSATKNQDQLVLEMYQRYRIMPPSEVEKRLKDAKLIDEKTPITSIRRSITSLTGEMKLQKTGSKQRGPQGRPEYLWKIIET